MLTVLSILDFKQTENMLGFTAVCIKEMEHFKCGERHLLVRQHQEEHVAHSCLSQFPHISVSTSKA